MTSEEAAMELFEERAAIMEFDGKIDRNDAERMAYYDTKTRYKIKEMPQEARQAVKNAVARQIGDGVS